MNIKKLTPQPILNLIDEIKKKHLKSKIVKYLENLPDNETNEELKTVLDYFKHNPITYFPYLFANKYHYEDVIVYEDKSSGFKYVLLNGKRLYYPKSWTEQQIQIYHNGILTEQDIDSAHRYETENFCVKNGDIVIDVGAAEGFFALCVIDKVKKIYLFEPDKLWFEALELTFKENKSKVEIIHSFVSDKSNLDKNTICLDDFLGNDTVNFIKADIEGFEPNLLRGSKKIISKNKSIRMALCSYHNQTDADVLKSIFEEYNMEYEFSKGYFLFLSDKNLKKPYLRKAVIRAKKNSQI